MIGPAGTCPAMLLVVTGPQGASEAADWEKQRIRARSNCNALGRGWNATETLGDQKIVGGFLLGERSAGVAGYRRGC
jgi:hypothetical protein